METIHCHQCGAINDRTHPSCNMCFAPLGETGSGRLCSACNTDNPETAAFCSACGSDLAEAGVAAAPDLGAVPDLGGPPAEQLPQVGPPGVGLGAEEPPAAPAQPPAAELGRLGEWGEVEQAPPDAPQQPAQVGPPGVGLGAEQPPAPAQPPVEIGEPGAWGEAELTPEQIAYQEQQAAAPAAEAAPVGQTTCPKCNMSTRAGPDCEWCGTPLAPAPVVAPSPAAAATAAARPAPREREEEKVNIFRLAAAVIFSPTHALDNLLPLYVRQPLGVLKILLYYVVCLSPGAAAAGFFGFALSIGGGGGLGELAGAAAGASAAIAVYVVVSLLSLIILSLEISLVNTLFGRSMGFFTDAAALALRFALVQGTAQLMVLSLILGLGALGTVIPGAEDFYLPLSLGLQLWILVLNLLVIVVTYDYGFGEAILVMIVAQIIGFIGALWIAAKGIGLLAGAAAGI